jgi:hypothetical protein
MKKVDPVFLKAGFLFSTGFTNYGIVRCVAILSSFRSLLSNVTVIIMPAKNIDQKIFFASHESSNFRLYSRFTIDDSRFKIRNLIM